MSRCIRKVENENFYIIYCNTSDVLFSYMFDSLESAIFYKEAFDNNESWTNNMVIDNGILSINDLIYFKKNGKW